MGRENVVLRVRRAGEPSDEDAEKLCAAFGAEYVRSLSDRCAGAAAESLSAALLLLDTLRELGIPPRPVRRNAAGKPFFAGADGAPAADLFFSLSHDRGLILCALAPFPVGADLAALPLAMPEEKQRRLAARYLAPAEAASGQPFEVLWTRLEACSKLLGGNLSDVLGREYPENVRFESFRFGFGGKSAAATVCRFRPAEEEVRAISVGTPSGTYEVCVGAGILAREAAALFSDRRVCVVTDSGVPEEYPRAVAGACRRAEVFAFPAGEASKTAGTYLSLLEFLLSRGFDRSDCIAAVGGGVAGDLAGFAAATYMRGIDFYNFPTTLLSQVDSSVGGKTAIDFGGVKNSVGAFWQPRRVIADPETLRSLDPRQLACGYAELIKIAALFAPDLFAQLEVSDLSCVPAASVIARAVELKRNVVAADERDRGLRRALNFGHTLGHGIEAAASGSLLHGECVALGMTAMCEGETAERLRAVLSRAGLPTEPVRLSADAVMNAVSLDKKSVGGKITAVILDAVGSFRFEETDAAALRARAERILLP